MPVVVLEPLVELRVFLEYLELLLLAVNLVQMVLSIPRYLVAPAVVLEVPGGITLVTQMM